jgi:predicted nuclease with TOPRIM domain
MRERIEKRVAELESELQVGAQRLHNLEREEAELRETLVRMGGAVIALRELLRDDDPAQGGAERVDNRLRDLATVS